MALESFTGVNNIVKKKKDKAGWQTWVIWYFYQKNFAQDMMILHT